MLSLCCEIWSARNKYFEGIIDVDEIIQKAQRSIVILKVLERCLETITGVSNLLIYDVHGTPPFSDCYVYCQ